MSMAFEEESKDKGEDNDKKNDIRASLTLPDNDSDYTREAIPSFIVDGRNFYSRYGREEEESPDQRDDIKDFVSKEMNDSQIQELALLQNSDKDVKQMQADLKQVVLDNVKMSMLNNKLMALITERRQAQLIGSSNANADQTETLGEE